MTIEEEHQLPEAIPPRTPGIQTVGPKRWPDKGTATAEACQPYEQQVEELSGKVEALEADRQKWVALSINLTHEVLDLQEKLGIENGELP